MIYFLSFDIVNLAFKILWKSVYDRVENENVRAGLRFKGAGGKITVA